MKDKIIEDLRGEIDAARRKLKKETDLIKRAEIVGYIRGLQIAMVVVNKA